MRLRSVALLTAGVLLYGLPPATACTTILIGSALTADGSVIHAHNEDMGNAAVGRVWWTPPESHRSGTPLTVPYVELPQASRTLGYWASGNAEGAVGLDTGVQARPYDSVLVGMNERGVSMSCNWAHSKADNLEGVGIRRYAIRQILLERAGSARQGVAILGELIETYGQADWGGLIYHLADADEAWVVETTTHDWVARRVRDDEIRVTANRFRIGSDYDLASDTLVANALAKGWLDSPAERIDFAAVYGKPGKMDQPYDSRREDRVIELLAEKRGDIAPADVFPILRDRYEGTELYTPPQPGPVWREDLDGRPEISRTLSTNLTQSSFVARVRDEMPVEVGAVLWLGLATPSYTGYVPLWAGGGELPDEFTRSEADESDDSAWWLFRRLQRAIDRDYEARYPEIRDAWDELHGASVAAARAAEKRALALFSEGRSEDAMRLLAETTSDRATLVLDRVRRLHESLSEAPEPIALAVTIDDLPVAPPRRQTVTQQIEITDRLLGTLAEHRVPAIGFVNESRLEIDGEVDSRLVALLERWLDAGHELGNHGYSHLDLHSTDASEWLADVHRGERVLRPLLAERGARPRWFRHPFLHTGRSVEIQETTEAALADLGYRIAPVTIDNGEWIFGGAYARAFNDGDRAAMEQLGRAYVDYMVDVFDYYRDQAVLIVGEPIPQVLLIHAYALNADWLGELLERLEAEGVTWVPLEDAVAHPAYSRPTRGHTGPGGITWLHRWALSERLPAAVFAGEPEVPEWVRDSR